MAENVRHIKISMRGETPMVEFHFNGGVAYVPASELQPRPQDEPERLPEAVRPNKA